MSSIDPSLPTYLKMQYDLRRYVCEYCSLYYFKYKGMNHLFVLFVYFCGRLLSKELGIPIGILPMTGAGVDGNAPYQAQAWDTNKLPTS